VALTDVENTPYLRSRPANPQIDPLQNVRTFLQPSEQFEQKDHRMFHASIEQRLQTNLTEQKTLWTPTRRICTIQHEDYILQESALHSLQKRRVNIIYRRPYKGSILEPGSHIGDRYTEASGSRHQRIPCQHAKQNPVP
jgi:diphthamide synthase subunit DPH2